MEGGVKNSHFVATDKKIVCFSKGLLSQLSITVCNFCKAEKFKILTSQENAKNINRNIIKVHSALEKRVKE